MKNLYALIILFSLLFSIQTKSQELMIEGGKSLTSLKFKDSQGENLDNLQATSQNYISLGFRKNVVKDVLHIVLGTGINSYGAIGSDNTVNNFFEWETTYLGIYAGVDVRLYKANNVSFFLRGTTSAEFILQGSQTLNNQVFNLVGEEDFDKTNFFFRGGAIVSYEFTESVSVFFQYKYGQSLQKLNTDASSNNLTETNLNSHDIGFGLVINLQKNKL